MLEMMRMMMSCECVCVYGLCLCGECMSVCVCEENREKDTVMGDEDGLRWFRLRPQI